MLKFDDEFKNRSQKDQIDYLMKLCDSQNTALDLMQKERNSLLVDEIKLVQLLKSAEQAFYIQKNIAANIIIQANTDKQEAATRIHELENEVEANEAFKNGHIH